MRRLPVDFRPAVEEMPPTAPRARSARRRILDPVGGYPMHGQRVVLPADFKAREILSVGGEHDDACVLTVTLSTLKLATGSETSFAGSDAPVVAGVIEWGIAGCNTRCDFDWLNGTSFTIAASWLRIRAANVGAGADLRVGAFVGYGPVAHARPPQQTVGFGGIPAGGTSFAETNPPQYASRGTVIWTPPTVVVAIQLLAPPFGAPTVLGQMSFAEQGVAQPSNLLGFPISADTRIVRVVNTDAAVAVVGGEIIWELNL